MWSERFEGKDELSFIHFEFEMSVTHSRNIEKAVEYGSNSSFVLKCNSKS